MTPPPDLIQLSHAEKDALILALWQRLEAAEQRVAELEARRDEPAKTPDNSSVPPSKGQKPNRPEQGKRNRPRQGSLGRKGGGRPLACDPDETVTAKVITCMHCQAGLAEADQVLHARYDKIDLPPVRPVVTRVERYAGHCPCCGVSLWHRCPRAWSRVRPSARTSRRWRAACASRMPSATNG